MGAPCFLRGLVRTAVDRVSTTRSLQPPVVATQRLANVDFGERITTYLSRFMPSISMRDTSDYVIPTVRRCDGTILRDLELTVAEDAGSGWVKRGRTQ